MKLSRRVQKISRQIGRHKRDFTLVAFGAGVALLGTQVMAHEQQASLPLSSSANSIAISWLPENVRRWDAIITTMADKYNIDPNLLAIIMTIESGGNPQARSPVGAEGLMQIMPPTAKDIATKHLKQPVQQYDLKDPKTSIEFGAAYLAYLRGLFGTNAQAPTWDQTVELVAAGYNGGPGAARNLRDGKGLTSQETASYARDALNLWRERHTDASPTYARWLSRGGDTLVRNN